MSCEALQLNKQWELAGGYGHARFASLHNPAGRMVRGDATALERPHVHHVNHLAFSGRPQIPKAALQKTS